ncbi:MAG: CHRD domain-containing protein [Actinomycetota bacterium]|nr:CHRD domain-containing protein [Actinomycetota bacterium]
MKRFLIAVVGAMPLVLAGVVATAGADTAGTAATAQAPARVTICHKTGSDSNAWRRITVSGRAVTNPSSSSGRSLRAHLRHTGDAVVVGTAACPSANVTPEASATPAARVTICHKTGSTANPFRRITVSSRAVTNPGSSSGRTLRGHMSHSGDMLLPGANACPPGTQQNQARLTANLEPVTGATGSGTASVTIRVGATELCYTLTVTGLTDVTAAHIHLVATGAVVVPLTAPTSGTSSGCVTVARSLLQEIVRTPQAFYINVHTATFPNGQVQGRLSR